jgi:iron complex transport system permease protein
MAGKHAALIGAITLLSMAGAALIGSVPLSPEALWAAFIGAPLEPGHHTILWALRAPRIALAALVGASLALSGAALQGLFRNPLADPYVLGVSAGGALGAALMLVIGHPALAPIAAGVGAFGAGLLVLGFARLQGGLSLDGVLLAGVAIGLTLSAGLSLVLVQAGDRAGDVLIWLMGHLGGKGWGAVYWVAGSTLLGGGLIWLRAVDLDALLLGEEVAIGLGVRVERAKLIALAAASILVAGAVAFCGLIGFVGLVVPHLARFAVGPLHGRLLPLSAILGAGVLVWADTVARAGLPVEVPVGVITGLLGGPIFLILLLNARAR